MDAFAYGFDNPYASYKEIAPENWLTDQQLGALEAGYRDETSLALVAEQPMTKAEKRLQQLAEEQAQRDAADRERYKEQGADFYVAPNNETVGAAHKEWIGTNMRDEVISSVDNHSLRSVV